MPRLTLRAKLALVSLVMLALPWLGYRYVQEMERFLLAGQQGALLATARAAATMLHERPRLMKLTESAQAAPPVAAETIDDPLMVELGRVSETAPNEQEIGELLKGMEKSGARVWVVNRELKVLAVAGSLKSEANHIEAAGALRRLLALLIAPPTLDFDDAIDEDVLIKGREIVSALLGAPSTRLRNTPDGRAVVASAAHPVWSGSNVVGVVVAEETTHPVLALRNEALENLLAVTLLTLAAIALLMLGFATRLSSRIRRLRDEAEGALDARGRIARLATASDAADEIGDLSRSFSAMLTRLRQHHDYLQSLASRLSHELRTPVAVVRSSLENLRLAELPDDQRIYLDRAEEGIVRLNRILSRMTEATRLEASLAEQERERFDLAHVVRECLAGYRLAYRGETLELTAPDTPVRVFGSPDLAAQLLDKLIANALDFRLTGSPLRIALSLTNGHAELRVENRGAPLPEELRGKLFGSMISSRPGSSAGGEPHLGLGLYIARLIAEFHGGTIAAENLADASGVVIVVSLPATH
jgi:two-component system, OmpR family, sensor histidine kinase ChvG